MSTSAVGKVVMSDDYVREALDTGADVRDCLLAWMTDKDENVTYNDFQSAYFKAVRLGLEEDAIPGVTEATSQKDCAKARQKHMRNMYRSLVFHLT